MDPASVDRVCAGSSSSAPVAGKVSRCGSTSFAAGNRNPEHAFGANRVKMGHRVGCIALDISRLHPWPVVVSFGDNLSDLDTFRDRMGLKRYAENGHCYEKEIELAGKFFVLFGKGAFCC